MRTIGTKALFPLILLLFACSGRGKPMPSQEQLTAALRLAEMWGHLEASRVNADSGHRAMALAHAEHPFTEGWPLVRPHLPAETAQRLREGLDLYRKALENPSDRLRKAAWFQAQLALSEALTKLLNHPRPQAWVVRALLGRVLDEYREAWQGEELVNLAEYQDARGYLRVARVLYGEISPPTAARDSLADATFWIHLNTLRDRLSPLQPTHPPVPVGELAATVQEIQGALTRVWQLPPQATPPEELLRRAEERLRRALDTYARGDTVGAYELAVSAYLDGFEELEGPLMERGKQPLVLRMEELFRTFREGIREGRPLPELQEVAAQLQAGLKEAGGTLR